MLRRYDYSNDKRTSSTTRPQGHVTGPSHLYKDAAGASSEHPYDRVMLRAMPAITSTRCAVIAQAHYAGAGGRFGPTMVALDGSAACI
jgi:hypothetical protein